MPARRHLLAWSITVFVALALTLPTLVVVPLSFTGQASFAFPPETWSLRWYENFFSDAVWLQAFWNSVRIALLSSLVATVAGTAAALGITRWSRRRAGSLVRVLLITPMVIPGIILAIGIYAVFATLGLLGTTTGFVVAHSALGLPFVLITVTASLLAVDPDVEKAAASLGATPATVFLSITLPLIAPGVAVGALFGFVSSFDEVLVALFVQTPFLETLPVVMYTSVTESIDPTIAAASTIVLIVSTAPLVVGGLYMRHRSRRLGAEAGL